MSTDLARLKIAACAALFSTAGAAIKFVSLNAWQVACFRSGIAALAVFLLLPSARRRWTPRVWVVGAAYGLTMILFVTATKLTTAANAIFLQATAPLYVSLLAPWLLREPLRRADVGVLVAIGIGLALFFIGSKVPLATAPNPALGDVLAVLSGVTMALGVVGLRWMGRSGEGGETILAVVAANVLAFALSLPFALPVRGSLADWATVGYLGVFQIGVAYALLASGIRQVTALEATLLLLLEPVLNPIWTWLVHGEEPAILSVVGGTLILGATAWMSARAAVDRRVARMAGPP